MQEFTDGDLLASASMIYIPGVRLPDGRVQVGGKVIDEWPPALTVGDLEFRLDGEERVDPEVRPAPYEVQACYVQ